jgi:hypothetical protein
VIVANFINEQYQRRRDRRARLISKYEALALAVRRFRRKTYTFVNDGRLLSDAAAIYGNTSGSTIEEVSPYTVAYREADRARDEYVDAYTILALEPGHGDVFEQCDVMDNVYVDYLKQFGDTDSPKPPKFDSEKFNEAYSKLIEALQIHKQRIEKILLKTSVPLPGIKR